MTDDQADPAPLPVDLSPLDPLSDAGHADGMFAAIVADAMAARRSVDESVVAQIGRWARPALVAAAVIVAVSLPIAARSGSQLERGLVATLPPVAAPDTAGRFGMPAPVAALALSGRTPTPAEIVAAFNTRWTAATVQ
jgi:hypothetical protein